MLMMLFEAGEPVLREHTLGSLARLGVTNVSVLHDERIVGVVLDGWAFDPTTSAEDARTAVAGAKTADVRVLLPLLQTAVSTANDEGGKR